MHHVIEGALKFQSDVFPERQALFDKLANNQEPEVLFITCSDSRIDPNLITQADPGELFICRNAGNIVPPHLRNAGGMTASIEFAVQALNVKHVVVCGHTDCGAMKAALDMEKVADFPHVSEWLGHSEAAVSVVKRRSGDKLTEDNLRELTEQNVKLQLQHLSTHPYVASRLATSEIELHGWVYDIGTGGINCWNHEAGEFIPLSKHYAA